MFARAAGRRPIGTAPSRIPVVDGAAGTPLGLAQRPRRAGIVPGNSTQHEGRKRNACGDEAGNGETSTNTALTLAERQRIVADALATAQQDAEGLLRRQRARLDACVPPVPLGLLCLRVCFGYWHDG